MLQAHIYRHKNITKYDRYTVKRNKSFIYMFIYILRLKTSFVFTRNFANLFESENAVFRDLDEIPCIRLIEVKVRRNCSLKQEHDVSDITERS